MKWFSFFAVSSVTASLFFAFTSVKSKLPDSYFEIKKNSMSCAPDRNRISRLLNDVDIPPMPGAGKYHWRISTDSDSAQFYFDQGINMYYGFHIIEALASFKKAARLDPKSAMVWWAQALALGPNINDVGYAASEEALATIEKAVSLSATASAVEKMLIQAMSARYSKDSTQSREKLNQDYADEMNKAYKQAPANADVAALYADAMMLQHPWDLWNTNGSPKAWTPRIREVLEKLLTLAPQHPGANHYYIHVMEASPYAAKALPSANRLGSLTPGLSHMVHMPSHIFLRVGQYNKGSEVNEAAVSTYKNYNTIFPAVAENNFLYQWHNLHMQVNCAMLAGRSEYGLRSAIELRNAIDTSALSLPAPIGNYVQYLYMTPALLHIRFAQWNTLLQMEAPASNHVYGNIIYHLGKGMAFAAQKNFSAAENEKKAMKDFMKDESLNIGDDPFSPPLEGAKCAEKLLSGFVLLQQNKLPEAIAELQQAVAIEANMVYNEPRDWFLSPKPFLGKAYLAAGKWKEAQTIFENDLKVNADNVWSLYGLQQALAKQRKTAEASRAKATWTKAAVKSDIKLELAF